jgi:hypothetical protein
MFQDLDATLTAVLRAAPAPVKDADVSFEQPDRDFAPDKDTVNLFLHEVVENRTLRETAPYLERLGDDETAGYRSVPPPLRVDCTYLVTAWARPEVTGAGKTAVEHTLLGTTLLWLSRFATVDDRFLSGSMQSPPQRHPLPLTVAQPRSDPGTGEFWNALGVAPRPAFSVTVTIGMTPVEEVEEYPALEHVRLEPVLRTDPVLTGLVLDAALAPVPGAQVNVVEANRDATTDDLGRFTFPGLAFGRWTLRVVTGPHDVSRPVAYAADGQVHDVVLP